MVKVVALLAAVVVLAASGVADAVIVYTFTGDKDFAGEFVLDDTTPFQSSVCLRR